MKLVEERLVIHWAAQIVAAAAGSRIPPRSDFSHTNLGWDDQLRALTTHPIDSVRVGLKPTELTIVVLDQADIVAERPLVGTTLSAGLAWLSAELDERSGQAVKLQRLDHDMPTHAVGDGAPFPEPTRAYADVSGWFADAHAVVSQTAADHGDHASAARCWPHHFDLATLIAVEPHADPELAKTIGVGMTPGDGSYAEPYFYVAPWPRPQPSELGALALGHWHTDGWIGGVLTASELDGAADRRAIAREFIRAATDACRAALRSTPPSSPA